ATEPDKKPHTITIEEFVFSANKFMLPYRPAATSIATKLAIEEFLEDFHQEFDQTRIKFRAQLKSIRWSNGVCKLYTSDELPKVPSGRRTLSIDRRHPFEVVMTEDEAAELRPGQVLELEGTVTFSPRSRGYPGRSQVLYHVSTRRFGTYTIVGAFTTVDYEIRLDREELQPRWTSLEDEK
ncbi:MAG: hypothetical protein ACE37I_21545, partial [Rubinisphaera brasiliensis]|uniref:hypothetical protein n=1 Tax=Rubinisphaera brasiliensis TaxID=119 RepID=UPI00391DFFA4